MCEAGRPDRHLYPALREKGLKKQTTKKPAIAQTSAQVGIVRQIRDMSVGVELTSPIGRMPVGVATWSCVHTMSPIVTSGGACRR